MQHEPKRRSHRLWRWLLVPPLLVLLLFGGGLIALNTEPGEAWVQKKIMQRLRGLMPGAQARDLEGFVPFWVDLLDVQIATTTGEIPVTVERVRINFNLVGVLKNKMHLEEAVAHGAHVHVHASPLGGLNVLHLFEVKEKGGEAPEVIIETMRVASGTVLVDLPNQASVRLEPLQLRGALVFDPEINQLSVMNLETTVRHGELDARLEAAASYRIEGTQHDAEATVKISGLAAAPPVMLTLSGRGTLRDLSVRAAADLPQRGRADLKGNLNVPRRRYRADLTISNLQPQQFRAAWPEGDMNLQARIKGHGVPLRAGSESELHATVVGMLAETTLPRLELHGTLHNRTWRGQLTAQAPSIELRGDGEGTLQRASFNLHATTDPSAPLPLMPQQLRLASVLELTATISRDGPVTVDGEVQVQRAFYKRAEVRGLVAQLKGEGQPQAREGSLKLTTQRFVINGNPVRRAMLNARLQAQKLSVDGQVRLAPGVRPAELEVVLPLEDDLTPNRDAPLTAAVRWFNGDLSALLRSSGTPLRGRGRVWARGWVEGTLADPTVHLHADWRRARIEQVCTSACRAVNLPAMGGRLRLRSSPEQTQVLAQLTHRDHQVAELVARSPAQPRSWLQDARWQQPITVTANLEDAQSVWLHALWPRLPWQQGQLSGEVNLSGTLARPQGSVALHARDIPGIPTGSTFHLETKLETLRDELRLQGEGRVDHKTALTFAGSVGATAGEVLRGEAKNPHLSFSLEGELPAGLVRPQLTGDVTAHVQLAGRFTKLQGRAELAGRRLHYNGELIGTPELSVQLSPQTLTGEVVLRQPQHTPLTGDFRWDLHDGWQLNLNIRELESEGVSEVIPSIAAWPISGELHAKGMVEPTGGNAEAASLMELLRRPVVVQGSGEVVNGELALYLVSGEYQPPGEGAQLRRLDDFFEAVIPFHISSFELRDSTVSLIDASEPGLPMLTLTDVHWVVENLASRRHLMGDLPAVITARGLLEGSGELSILATLEPTEERPVLSAQAGLRALQLADINEYLRAALDLNATGGTFSAFAVFQIKGQQLTGGVKPMMQEAEVEPAHEAGLLKSIGIEIADLVTELVESDRAEAVATVIPLQTDLNNVDVQLIPTLLGVVRNAFVESLAAGFTNVPPGTAARPEPFLEQASEALSKRANWPERQPP